MIELNEPQKRAATSDAAVTLILAGPGSGKTRTLVGRIAHLIETGVNPSEISAITFTNAAGRELEDRYRKQAGDGAKPLGYTGTLHGFCLRLISRFGETIGIEDDIAVIDEEQASSILDRVISDLSWKGSRRAIEKKLAEGLIDKTSGMTEDEVVVHGFYNLLLSEGLLTYDAILFFAAKIAESVGPHVGFGHVLVDEVQDCSPIDFRILDLLSFDSRTFVGDPDQAIYSFRGGSIEGINSLAKSSEVDVFRLEDNYRSGREVCALAQGVIEENLNRVDKDLWPATDVAGEIDTFESAYPDDEAREIARRIKEDGVDEVAVLVRTNAIAKEVSGILEAAGVPIRKKLVERLPEEWMKARAIVSFLANPFNDILAHRFLVITRGEDAAESVRKAALANYEPINEAEGIAPDQIALARVPEFLARSGIGVESTTEVEARIADLPDDATITDLSLAMGTRKEDSHEDGAGVVVTTIHSAKGREWHTVYLPALEADVFPGRRKDMDLEEERRLFFVGLTRAKRKLVLSRSLNRVKPFTKGGPQPTEASTFLREAGRVLESRKGAE